MDYQIGLSVFCNNTSACLYKTGEVVFAVEEERLNRIKGTDEFPLKSLKACLDFEGISIKEVKSISVSINPFNLIYKLKDFFLNLPFSFNWIRSVNDTQKQDIISMILLKRKLFSLGFKKVFFVNHHLAHASSAFFSSSFDKALIISLDGMGLHSSGGVFLGEHKDIKTLKEFFFPNSLGYVYNAVTPFLGFIPNREEGSLMALASLGKPSFYNNFKNIIKCKGGELFFDQSFFNFINYGFSDVKRNLFSKKFISIFGKRRFFGEEFTKRHKDIAASFQKRVEEVVLELLNYWLKKTNSENVCLSGGVFLNCEMNGFLYRKTKKNFFAFPANNDAGTSVGAVLFSNRFSLKKKPINLSYLGPGISNFLFDKKLKMKKIDIDFISTALKNGKIIAVCKGRCEFGPRALGNRSILADPRKISIKNRLNKFVKLREEFRPFAPVVLENYANDFFKDSFYSPYMLFSFLSKDENRIKGVVHQGTSRIQVLRRKDNSFLYDLIENFYQKTGIPMLLNTSFNVKGQPIVCNEVDAVDSFLKMDLDYLILGDYIYEKIN